MSDSKLQRPDPARTFGDKARKACLLAVGWLATALAVLGIFLPLLPTVPLLLLAAACFARSSERLHRRLLEQRHLGPLLRPYLQGAGIPRQARNRAIVLLWAAVTASALLLVSHLWLRLLLFTVALTVTLYLLRLPLAEAAEVRPSPP